MSYYHNHSEKAKEAMKSVEAAVVKQFCEQYSAIPHPHYTSGSYLIGDEKFSWSSDFWGSTHIQFGFRRTGDYKAVNIRTKMYDPDINKVVTFLYENIKKDNETRQRHELAASQKTQAREQKQDLFVKYGLAQESEKRADNFLYAGWNRQDIGVQIGAEGTASSSVTLTAHKVDRRAELLNLIEKLLPFMGQNDLEVKFSLNNETLEQALPLFKPYFTEQKNV